MRILILSLAALALGACGYLPKMDDVVKDRQAEYKTSKSLPPLEVPPDLSSSTLEDRMEVPYDSEGGSATYSDYAGGRPTTVASAKVLPNPQGVRLMRDEDKRWLVLDGDPDQYWDRVREFWLENGLLLKIENPSIGIMETDWAENRADIPQGFLRSMLGKAIDSLYSTATRDKFRVRFERGLEPGTTEIYLSHRGAEEVVQGETTVWQPRPSDPELEAEMLNRLMVYLGVEKNKAERMIARTQDSERSKARLVRNADGEASLVMEDDFSRAWRRTGLALDRVGFTVQDRDRSRGLYFVRYVDPVKDAQKEEGFLSKLKFWGDDKSEQNVEYLISFIGSRESTEVVVLDKEGNRENSETAVRILTLLQEQLK